VRRLQLAAELRRLRLSLNLTIDDVSAAVGISKSTLSRIENAQIKVSLPILRGLLAVYQVDRERADSLEELAREARQRGWWTTAGGDLPTPEWRTLVGLEAAATSIIDFSSIVINGLLQTRGYTEALLRGLALPIDDVAARTELRMRRQERLGQFDLWTVLAEEVLHRQVGGVDVMRAQLRHLVAMSEIPHVTVQVLPFDAGEHIGLAGPFTVFHFEPQATLTAVYLEGSHWEACLEDNSEVEPYRRDFDYLRAQALSPKESTERLHQLAERT
jgi:transcriptional regulator with XRE-family HTH domain